MNRSILFLTIILSSASAVFGEEKSSSILTLERIFGKSEFKSESFSAQWLEESSGYTFLKKITEGKDEGGKEIWIAQPGKGKSEVLVTASELTRSERTSPLGSTAILFPKIYPFFSSTQTQSAFGDANHVETIGSLTVLLTS